VPADTTSRGTAGQVLAIDDTGMRVQAGAGTVTVTHAGEPGAAPVPARRWATDRGVAVGAVFDAVDPAIAEWALGRSDAPVVAGSAQ
jgi:hypothetical protein